jgi:AraC family transcriptional regulator, exoenzyme S synthesis regulatory protein ExsA
MNKNNDRTMNTVSNSRIGKSVLQDVASTIESCITTASGHGYLYTEDHFLLLVERGCYGLRHGGKVHFIKKGEMVLVPRGFYIEYWNATSKPLEHLQYKAFHLKDHVLKEFSMLSKMECNALGPCPPVTMGEVNDYLLKYLESLEIYFKERRDISNGLVRLKLLELLFNLLPANKDVLAILLRYDEGKMTGHYRKRLHKS